MSNITKLVNITPLHRPEVRLSPSSTNFDITLAPRKYTGNASDGFNRSAFVPANDPWAQFFSSVGFHDEHGVQYRYPSIDPEEIKQSVDTYFSSTSLPTFEQSASSNAVDLQCQGGGYTDINPLTGELVSFPDDPAEIDKILATFASITGLTWPVPQDSTNANATDSNADVSTSSGSVTSEKSSSLGA